MWTEVNFGKWRGKGKTLPQIIVTDPDWFFWAVEDRVLNGRLASEAQMLNRRASAIRLPPDLASTHCVQYVMGPDGKFSGFNLIPQDQGAHLGSSSEIRRNHLDLSAPRQIKGYDKLGCQLMIRTFRYYWFEDKPFTKKRVEPFFDNPANFVKP